MTAAASAPPAAVPLLFRDLAARAREPGLAWHRLRDGVDIHRLYGDEQGPSAALLRYAPGGRVPRHLHQAHEHIFVLSGSQQDERGVYVAGDLVVNVAGSAHAVESPGGCLVLAVWLGPIRFGEP